MTRHVSSNLRLQGRQASTAGSEIEVEDDIHTLITRIEAPRNSPTHFSDAPPSPREAVHSVMTSWVSKKFMSGCAILFPIAVTVYVTWWFLDFFDAFFSPLYKKLVGYEVFGLGFVTSMVFIFATGVLMSSWAGGFVLSIGEWVIKQLPLVKNIYSASKQVSAALNPENEAALAFKECVLIKHPRNGEYAFGFITGETWIHTNAGQLQLNSVYVPTNHVYVGDIFMLADKDILRPNLTVREGLEIVISCGMALPRNLTASNRN